MDGGTPRTARGGKPHRRLRRHLSQEGNWTRRAQRGYNPRLCGGTPFHGRGLFGLDVGTPRTARGGKPPRRYAAPLPRGELGTPRTARDA
ncbi:MAG: hypothetical protein LBM98_09870 [Oscillospiraceae bacterium]|nr:hypothetical protein [Oscillospiraceae bacterium]